MSAKSLMGLVKSSSMVDNRRACRQGARGRRRSWCVAAGGSRRTKLKRVWREEPARNKKDPPPTPAGFLKYSNGFRALAQWKCHAGGDTDVGQTSTEVDSPEGEKYEQDFICHHRQQAVRPSPFFVLILDRHNRKKKTKTYNVSK